MNQDESLFRGTIIWGSSTKVHW